MALTQRGEYLIFDKGTRPVIELSKVLPGKRRWKDGVLWVAATGNNIDAIIKRFPEVVELGLPAIDAYTGAGAFASEIRKAKSVDVPPGSWQDYPFKTQPLEAQIKAFALSRDREYFAYFMEMGMGKTKVNIDIGGDLWLKGWIDIMVVLAPNGVHRQWVLSELPRHMSESVPYKAFAHSSKWLAKDKKDYADVI